MVSDHSGDTEAYVLSSKYRSAVLEHLTRTARATPTEIAEATGEPRPHISRALSELQERGIVELRVPETRSVGRYYALTPEGATVWSELKAEIRDLKWSIEDPSGPAMEAVLAVAEAELGDRLRFVGMYDGEAVTIVHADPDALASYSDDELEQGLRTLVFDHTLDDLNVPDRTCTSSVVTFEEVILLRVRVDEDRRIGISFDRTDDVSIPSFAEAVAAAFENETPP